MRFKRLVDPLGRVFLHSGDDMTVDVERDRNARVARAFNRDLRVNAGGE